MEHIGARIKRYRETKSLTQADVYRDTLRIGIPVKQTTLSSIESGTEPKTGVITALSNAYPDLSADWLLTGNGEMLRRPLGQLRGATPVAEEAGATTEASALRVADDSEKDKWYKDQLRQKDEHIKLLTQLLRSGTDLSRYGGASFSLGNDEADTQQAYMVVAA